LSNLLNACRCADIYPAHRDYAVLPPQARLKFDPGTAEALAQRYVPSFKTLKAEHGCDASVAPKQLRYEVLPPKAGNPVYSIIYYVGMDTEKLPIPVIGKMYSWARVLLYGAQQDWEAIQVDVNAHTGRPEGLSYESSNYTGDPATFDTIQRRNLHLRTRVALARDGSWQHTIYQKNGQARSVETTDPFEGDKGPAMLVVAWNGSFDLQAVARHRGVDKMFDFSDQPERLAFLSIKDIRATSMDLRVSWTQARKEGQTVMRMPARKPSLVPQHVTLMAE
jgi:hypothetical protein